MKRSLGLWVALGSTAWLARGPGFHPQHVSKGETGASSWKGSGQDA